MTRLDLHLRRELAEELRAQGSSDAESRALLDDLAGLGDLVPDAAPSPSAELAALLDRPRASRAAPYGLVARLRERGRLAARRSGAASGAVVLALTGVGATGLSAAANSLPAPLQHRVSEFSRSYLPFDFPEPLRLDEPEAATPWVRRPAEEGRPPDREPARVSRAAQHPPVGSRPADGPVPLDAVPVEQVPVGTRSPVAAQDRVRVSEERDRDRPDDARPPAPRLLIARDTVSRPRDGSGSSGTSAPSLEQTPTARPDPLVLPVKGFSSGPVPSPTPRPASSPVPRPRFGAPPPPPAVQPSPPASPGPSPQLNLQPSPQPGSGSSPEIGPDPRPDPSPTPADGASPDPGSDDGSDGGFDEGSGGGSDKGSGGGSGGGSDKGTGESSGEGFDKGSDKGSGAGRRGGP